MDNYIIAQVIGSIALTGSVARMQIRCPKNMQRFGIVVSLMWITQYLFLGSTGGALACVLGIVRGLAAISDDKKVQMASFHGLNIDFVAFTFFTWAGTMDLLLLGANLVMNLILLSPTNRNAIAWATIACCSLWFMYDVAVMAWASAFTGLMVIGSTFVGMWRYAEKGDAISTLKSLFTLDNPSVEPAE